MSRTKPALAEKPRHNRVVKDRKSHPYVVFQVEKALKKRLAAKADKVGKSQCQFVEDLIRRAV